MKGVASRLLVFGLLGPTVGFLMTVAVIIGFGMDLSDPQVLFVIFAYAFVAGIVPAVLTGVADWYLATRMNSGNCGDGLSSVRSGRPYAAESQTIHRSRADICSLRDGRSHNLFLAVGKTNRNGALTGVCLARGFANGSVRQRAVMISMASL